MATITVMVKAESAAFYKTALIESLLSDALKSESDSFNNEDENENTANCYTSSSEHSVDTVIFCGKPLPTTLLSQPQIKSVASPQRTQCQKPNSASHHCSFSNQHQKQSHEHHQSKVNDIKKTEKIMCDNGTSPLHKNITNSTPKSDELWIDGPKKPKRKLPTDWSKELWVDGPNADHHRLCIRDVEYFDKQQRIQDWIQQHTKHIWSDFPDEQKQSSTNDQMQQHNGKRCNKSPPSTNHCCHHQNQQIKVSAHSKGPETTDACCQTETSEGIPGQVTTPSESDWSCDEDNIRSWSEDDFILSDQRHYDLERGALSDCCDNDVCCCSHDDDVHSEPITEPPKQLKLEQFLKQLITITAPNAKHQGDSHIRHHEKFTARNYSKLRHPDGASSDNLADWDLQKPDFVRNTINKDDADKATAVVNNSAPVDMVLNEEPPKNHTPVLPTSPRVNRILSGSSAAHNISGSPSKSSRKQQQQHKRNTTSTTTSGHGTTSEGECSSVAKKSSGSSSAEIQSHQLVVQSQPASSGYDSTIHDDESDRDIPAPPTQQQQLISQPKKVNTKVKLRTKSSRRKRGENDHKRNSVSSEKCSFLCCKFMDFY
ncbi:hypothetical protein B4U79_06505 [Dinothrombium tinctorium]|uniref:Uncharacterized protein n=1 Tax=Dinothrombium tinctorium TaxID=1965070 RepID=A0A3S3PX34_9ACAR|nr:hypothetical protein B4U79_06505 [Dinothrombium tinctorium]